jgi:crotonobetainyl-CoA:carnitine CoA-transferase CaiB-like acyl-CoA transferase
MVALHARNDTGRGQEIDVSLVEPLLNILGPQVTTYSRTGKKPQRIGNRSTNNAPRNLYKTKDGRWLAISTSATSIAERVMKLVGAEEVISEDWFSTAAGRVEHGDYLDSLVADWILERDSDEALQSFRRAGAAATLVYDVEDILSDSQLEALGTIKELPDNDGKNIKVLNVPFRMSSTPGEIRFTGRGHGQDNASVFSEVGVTASELQKLKSEGVI